MSLINRDELIDIFNILNESKLNYILLRNIGDELPSHLKIGKDIDVLIKKKDESNFKYFFQSMMHNGMIMNYKIPRLRHVLYQIRLETAAMMKDTYLHIKLPSKLKFCMNRFKPYLPR